MKNITSLPPHPCLSQAFEREPSGGGWNHPLTRRRFLKRSGGATVATMATWSGATLVARAVTGESGETGLYTWWVQKQKAVGVDVLVPNSQNLSVAEATKRALKIIDDNFPGTVVDSLKKQGGTPVDPPRYSTATGGITTSTDPNGNYIVKFPAGLIYKKELRE